MPRKKTAPFKCPQCDKTFAMAMHLGRHMTTHGRKAGRSAPARIAAPAANLGAAEQLEALISRLQSKRQDHEQAIVAIDAAFARFGITPTGSKRRGRRRGRAGKRGRR